MQIKRIKYITIPNPVKLEKHKTYEHYMLSKIKARAKRLNREFTLIVQDLFIPPYCPVLGTPLVRERSPIGNSLFTPSVDRIDNSKGYTKENIIIVCSRVNSLKSDYTLQELANTEFESEEMNKIKLFYKKYINNEKST